jgi:hypothetical protein
MMMFKMKDPIAYLHVAGALRCGKPLSQFVYDHTTDRVFLVRFVADHPEQMAFSVIPIQEVRATNQQQKEY